MTEGIDMFGHSFFSTRLPVIKTVALVALIASSWAMPASAGNCNASPVSGNYYSIINQGSGKALDISQESRRGGGNAIQWPYKSSKNQQFYLKDLGSGYWSLQAAHSGLVLDVSNESTDNGANIIQWRYHGGSNQQWLLKEADGGAFNIISRQSGKLMSVDNDASGANVHQRSDSTSKYQHWYFNPVDGSCSEANHPPAAHIESNAKYIAGQTVTLNGNGSSDPDGDTLAFLWTQTEGETISLGNNSGHTLIFTAPRVQKSTAFTLQLKVDDGKLSDSTSVQFMVLPETEPSTLATEICNAADEHGRMDLSCPQGEVITEITFASYGTPKGACGGYSTSHCDAGNSVAVVSDICMGKKECGVNADNALFGDPCHGTLKWLAVQVSCGSSTNIAPTISGAPSNSIAVGSSYSFIPSASDPAGDTLKFSIENLPAWAGFDVDTGALQGTPGIDDVGVYENIRISVFDGQNQASLPPFSIMVNGSQRLAGSLRLTWSAPKERSDGTPLGISEIGGYRIYLGKDKDTLEMHVDLKDGTLHEHIIKSLTPDTYFVAMEAYDVDGNVSRLSNIIEKQVAAE